MGDVLAPPQEDIVTLGDKKVELSTFDRYKGRKGETDRLGLICGGLPRGYIHYFGQGATGKSFRCVSTATEKAICCDKLGAPQQKFGVILFKYVLDPQDASKLLDDTKCQGKIMLWVISESRYEELSNMHKQWPLLDAPEDFQTKQHDIMVKCTEEQYQKMVFTPVPTAQWKQKEAWYKALKMRLELAKPKLKQAMGKTMTLQEIKELLGAAPAVAPGTTDNVGDIDLGGVLDE